MLHVPLDLSLPPDTTAGRISRVDRAGYDVLTLDGTLRVPALPPPRDERETPTVGDWLALSGGCALARLRRTSLLARAGPSRTSTVQPLAANVDVVLVCAGLVGDLPVRRIERLLTLAWDSGALPVLVLTKADLCDDVPGARRRAARHAPGVDVAVVSAVSIGGVRHTAPDPAQEAPDDLREDLLSSSRHSSPRSGAVRRGGAPDVDGLGGPAGDVSELDPYVGPGSTLVLLGASGAGKSTLLNRLAGREVMATGDVRAVDGKGRHTTSHRELFELPSGAVLIDTPGLRGVAVQGSEEALAQAFSDVDELAVACRFADCAHLGEPGCAVQASVDAGDLPVERVDSWRRLQRELAFQARRQDARLQSVEKQRWKDIHKQQRVRGHRP